MFSQFSNNTSLPAPVVQPPSQPSVPGMNFDALFAPAPTSQHPAVPSMDFAAMFAGQPAVMPQIVASAAKPSHSAIPSPYHARGAQPAMIFQPRAGQINGLGVLTLQRQAAHKRFQRVGCSSVGFSRITSLDKSGELIPGEYCFVTKMTAAGPEIRIAANREGASAHMGLLDSGNHQVYYAGTIQIGADSQLLSWTNRSGTFQCPAAYAYQAGLPLNLFKHCA